MKTTEYSPMSCSVSTKSNITSREQRQKKYIARVYFREDRIVLRLYFSGIDKHSDYIESASDFIKKPFVDESHGCKMPDCKGMITNGKCRYRKTYSISGTPYIKCAEQSFMYYNMDAKNAERYTEPLMKFYPIKKRKNQ